MQVSRKRPNRVLVNLNVRCVKILGKTENIEHILTKCPGYIVFQNEIVRAGVDWI